MSIPQLITRVLHFLNVARNIGTDPKRAFLLAKEQSLHYYKKLPRWNKEFDATLFAASMIIALCALALLAEYPLETADIAINEAGLYDKNEDYNQSKSLLDLAEMNNEDLAKEALLWLSVLKSYDDFSLSNEQLMLKFKNMSVAYTILSSTADGPLRRKFWSEQAIKYGRLSLGVLEGMVADKDLGEWEEIKTRVLIAMAINYYEDGAVEREELVNHFEKISKSFLVRTGFCNNRVLRTLHEDEIIELPNYFSEKST
ncbi:MAG: hypothetical protein AAFZ15_04590 [Bacteroidota bacterium]